jgi:hypothetical protein
MNKPSKSGSGLVRLGDLLPRAEIPQWDEWQERVAAAAESRKPSSEFLRRIGRNGLQLKLPFDDPA